MHYHRLTAALAAAGVVILSGCAKPAQQAHGPAPLDVSVAQAQRRNIATYITLDGQISPLEQANLSFQQSGPIAAVYVNQGDRVSAGEVLAKIDDSTLRAQLAQAQAQIAQATAQAQSSSLNVPITQSQTTQAVQAARGALASAQLTYSQDQSLYKQGYVSQSALEQAHAAYIAAQSQYQTALANQGTTKVQSSNAQAAQGALAAARASANTLRTEIGQTTLYAPFAGIVTARLADPGAMASPSTPVLSVSKINPVWVNINVPDQDLPYVRPGTTVNFTASDAAGKQFTGHIDTLNAVPTQGTLSYQARIKQPNPNDVLRGGMLVSVTIQQARHNGAIVVPRSAVAQTGQGTDVYIVGPGKKAEEVPVHLGLQTDTLSEVRSPKIGPGTLVITTRPDALQNGSLVAFAGGKAGGQ